MQILNVAVAFIPSKSSYLNKYIISSGPTFNNGCNNISMLRLRSIQVSKRGAWKQCEGTQTYLANVSQKYQHVCSLWSWNVTETKSMCWQVFSNKYNYSRLSVLEYIVLWTWCVILVVTITNSRPGAPMNTNICGFEMTSQLLPLTLNERTSHRSSDDAICDLRHDLRRDLSESRWFSFVNTTWLGPGPSLKWDSVRVQAKSWVKSQAKTVSEYGPRSLTPGTSRGRVPGWWDPGIRTNTGAGDTVLAKHT